MDSDAVDCDRYRNTANASRVLGQMQKRRRSTLGWRALVSTKLGPRDGSCVFTIWTSYVDITLKYGRKQKSDAGEVSLHLDCHELATALLGFMNRAFAIPFFCFPNDITADINSPCAS